MPPARTTYLAGSTGRWRIDSITGVTGEGIPDAARIDIAAGPPTGSHRQQNRRTREP